MLFKNKKCFSNFMIFLIFKENIRKIDFLTAKRLVSGQGLSYSQHSGIS